MSVLSKNLDTTYRPAWCPGCGNFGIHTAIKNALIELQLEPENVFIVTGIGCFSKHAHALRTYGVHAIHGRALPVALGAKLANHELTVIVIGGDGDSYGIGAGHFVHTMRRNPDITLIVCNNLVYGLTTGQFSPTSKRGQKTRSTPFGVNELPFEPLAVAILCGATFVARGFSGDIKHLTELTKAALRHRGFALLDVLQPCVTFNRIHTNEYYRQRIYRLEDISHDVKNKLAALERALEWKDDNCRIPIGIFYREEALVYEDTYPALSKWPLARQELKKIDISAALEELK